MGCSWVPGRPCSTVSMGPEHVASVGTFYLDTFEATVGRFRQFAEEYNDWRAAGNPLVDAGAHPRIADSGWQVAWERQLPGSSTSFDFDLPCSEYQHDSWKISSGSALPQNCLSWAMAFAFCVWSGGRLPTEAEWEIAAAGADENRLYAWGISPPTPELALYNVNQIFPPDGFWLEEAGSRRLGLGRFGHFDLSGSLSEWTLDQYSETWFKKGGGGNPCNDCANLGAIDDSHVVRAGSWEWSDQDLLVAARVEVSSRASYTGARCARDRAAQ